MLNRQKAKKEKKERRHKRQRAKIKGTKDRPRLSVFRSNNHIFCQIVNDEEGKTLVSANDLEIKEKKKDKKQKKSDKAFIVGGLVAKKAIDKKIKKVVFDKGCSKYHGRIKSVADGARKGGLKF